MLGRRLLLSCLGVLALTLATLPGSALAFGPVASFGSGEDGTGPGELVRPSGLAVAANGDIYVSDQYNNRVSVFAASGAFLFAFGKDVNSGAGDPDVCTTACQVGTGSQEGGALTGPEGVAVDAAGNVYVSSYGNSRVEAFTAAGSFLRAFGEDVNAGAGSPDLCTVAADCQEGAGGGGVASTYRPFGLDVDTGSGLVYVTAPSAARINVFTTAGIFVRAFGSGVNAGAGDPNVCTDACKAGGSGQGAGQMNQPSDVQVLPGGLVAISETSNRRVAIYTAAGAFVRAFGHGVNLNPDVGEDPNVCTTDCVQGVESSSSGSLKFPRALTVDAAGTIYVADALLNRVSEFKVDGSFVRAFGQGVDDAAAAFQVCTAASGCVAGTTGASSGAINEPNAIAVSGSEILVGEAGSPVVRVEAFGEPRPPAPPAPTPSGAGAPTPTPVPSNAFSFGKLNLKKGTGVLAVKVQAAGKLVAKGAGIKKATKTAKGAATVKLAIKLAGAAQRKLLEEGVSKVTVKITFTPAGGDARTKQKKLTLKLVPPK